MNSQPQQSPTKRLGQTGEKLACDFLVKKHFQILETNYHFKHLEIDIIALDQDKQELVFVEVKTRANNRLDAPIAHFKNRQLYRIVQAAQHYLHTSSLKIPYRFDIIGILPHQIEHLQNITAE